jgi:hypothetical protein
VSQRFAYSVYGLHIRSDFALWPWGGELQLGPASRGDVSIELTSAAGSAVTCFRPGLREAVLFWPGVATFWIREGDSVRVAPASSATLEDVALVTAGPVLALLLEQRGFVVLHGSCVDLGGRAVTFLGASGSGKSTIAASLRSAGHALLSDGMTVVDCAETEPFALPGPPHLKLWPDAVNSLGSQQSQTRPVAPQAAKLWYRAIGGLTTRPVPLREAFLLQSSSLVACDALAPAAGLVGLIKNYFLADFADAVSREFILDRCAMLARRLTVSTLARGASLSAVPSLLACIARDDRSSVASSKLRF